MHIVIYIYSIFLNVFVQKLVDHINIDNEIGIFHEVGNDHIIIMHLFLISENKMFNNPVVCEISHIIISRYIYINI